MRDVQKLAVKGLTLTSLLTAPVVAFSAIDTVAVLAELDAVETAIAAVGAGILVLAAIALGYRWVKATFF